MISKQAVREFLKNKPDDWVWLKKLTRTQLEKELNFLIPGLVLKTKPRVSQLVCLIIGYYNSFFTYHLDMGLGKSKLIIDVFTINKKINNIKNMLVVAPNVISIGNWGDQIEEHSDYSWIGLEGTKEERLSKLKIDKDIYVINYAGLLVLLTNIEEVEIEKSGKEEVEIEKVVKVVNKKVLNRRKLLLFCKKFNMIVWDEIHSGGFSKWKSVSYKINNGLSKNIKYRYGLTGTPMGRDPLMLWPQFLMIDRGESLGTTLGLYQQTFFNKVQGDWAKYYELNKEMETVLRKRIGHRSIRYKDTEIGELPLVIRHKVEFKIPSGTLRYYQRAAEGYRESVRNGEYVAVKNSFIKLRQMTAGFLGFKNEDEDRISIIFDENPKLEKIEEIVKGIPENDKILIFNDFVISGDLIEARLKKMGVGYARLYGKTKDKEKVRTKFLKDFKCKVFLMNSQSGSVSLNLQIARYGIFYESPVSPLVRSQAEKRYTGLRQKNKAFIYDFVMKNSIDERVLEFIKEGKDISASLIDGKVEL